MFDVEWLRRMARRREHGANQDRPYATEHSNSVDLTRRRLTLRPRDYHGLWLNRAACRDFAVLMMEAMRSLGLATRFVTGNLYDDLSGQARGGGFTHAWRGVYLPGAGWSNMTRPTG